MESLAHGAGAQRASVPRIVLPITSRGLLVSDRLCWTVLAVAMAVSAALILYLNRATTFFIDEMALVFSTPGLGATDVIEPYNGHLAITSKLLFKVVLEGFGADYLVFRLLHVGMLLVVVGLFYALVKRRIGALPALVPAVVLLFFGSAYTHTAIPIGLGIFICLAAGLGALLALERHDLRGDIAACGLLVISIATFTTGLAFLVGVTISVLLRNDRVHRAWVFVVPLTLYVAWWLWSLSSPTSAESHVALSNVLLIPDYAATSLAAVSAALAGLNFPFAGPVEGPGWGAILALLAIVGLVWWIAGRRVPATLWASLGILLAFWALGALVTDAFHTPGSNRYVYTGAILTLLIASDVGRSVRFTRVSLAVLLAVGACSLATNLALLRDGAASFRNSYTPATRVQFAMLELARDRVDPGFDPQAVGTGGSQLALVGAPAGPYLEVVDRYGPLGYSLVEVQRQSEPLRQNADLILARALNLHLEPAGARLAGRCDRLGGDAASGFELPVGGAILRSTGRSPTEVSVGRFANKPTAGVGTLAPDEAAELRVPSDSSSVPWRASVSGARSVEVCALR